MIHMKYEWKWKLIDGHCNSDWCKKKNNDHDDGRRMMSNKKKWYWNKERTIIPYQYMKKTELSVQLFAYLFRTCFFIYH